ncbi:hypothetical protein JYP46_01285 [Nitratireductor aquimarinus]|uniref:hypothetical protein n=1 Tax=Alphaproteobacteria TaxID=28211 RepID=UPI0019D34FE2|nr:MULTISPECIES: hypothetical protein [Alphaproteobacteria]MBN7755443.1 hypothetical protein [Nitratireductor aquimarinus]MBY5998198.1 hypothetical protein [Tritonibacter mobilis]MBY6020225.1 hypothetical protein [Nitratireductor sp. DP7N14-4]
MSARDIIAKVFGRLHRETCYPDASSEEKALAADAVMIALISSGYRILAPGEMDRIKAEERERGRIEAIEAAAKRLEGLPSFGDGKWAAAAIRALGGGDE